MSVNDGAAQLSKAQKTLQLQWERTREGWHDHVRGRFESDHLEALSADVKGTLAAMSRLAELFARIRRDCS